MVKTVFADWTSALTKMQACVTKDLEEIRKQKAEIQQLKDDIFTRLSEDKYIRNDKRIILSAPEIIIGNVDGNGMLYGDSGSVIIRGGNVNLEGSGNNGKVNTKATIISQIAVDPGADGVQEAVLSNSMIINQARNIVIQSNDAKGVFSQVPQTAGCTGVHIHADENIDIEATKSVEVKGNAIKNLLTALEKDKIRLTQDMSQHMKEMTSMTAEMEALLQLGDTLNAGELMTRTNVLDLDENQEKFEALVPQMHNALESYIHTVSLLAETNRRITALKAEQSDLNSAKANFKKNATNTHLTMHAERMDIGAVDGDGNIRENKEAVINVQTSVLDISTRKADGSLIDNSGVNIATQNVFITTANPKIDKKGNGEEPLVGNFLVNSKNVVFDSTDYSIKKGSPDEKEQTKDSSFVVRAENLNFSSHDKEGKNTGKFMVDVENMSLGSSDKDGNTTGSFQVKAKEMGLISTDKDQNATGSLDVKVEKTNVAALDKTGKATGQIVLNSKNVFVKSMDTDKGKDKKLAEGGNMVLVAEKMFVGRTKKANTSKQLIISSDKTGVFGATTTEIQQDNGKTIVQLSGGNLSMSGSKTGIFGETTVNGKTTFKADVQAPKLSADNLEAKTSFKSTNIADGIALPSPPSAANLKASLKEEDAPAAS